MKCNDFVVVTDGKNCVLEYFTKFYNETQNRVIYVPDSMYADFIENYYQSDVLKKMEEK